MEHEPIKGFFADRFFKIFENLFFAYAILKEVIFPAQTSLIPIQIALARFLVQGGNILGNYPYWYLGTTPYRYLTGPILPSILVLLHRIFPGLSLFEIFFGLIGLAFPLGAFGIYLFVKELGAARLSASLVAFLYFFGLLIPLLFRFSDGRYLITFSSLPFIFLAYFQLLKKWSSKKGIFCSILIAFAMLLDALIIPTLILGLSTIFLAQVGWKRAEEKLKRSLLVIAGGLLLATLWYSPGYWLTLLQAPSLTGKGLASVAIWILKLLPTVLALGMAIFSVRFFKKKNPVRDFCFYWLFIFGFLTLLRFLSDPDFWLDWTAYSLELQLGLSVLGGLVVERLVSHTSKMPIKIMRMYANTLILSVVCCSLFVVWLFLTNKFVLATLQQDITNTVEYKIGRQLSETAKPGERAFLSGTSAFWLNAFFDVPQVRGGVDQASVDKAWRKATWEIRDGSAGSPQGAKKSVEWLKKLGVKYLVVHTEDSDEFYHDFAYPEKFEEVEGLEKVCELNGDRIYRILD